MEDYRNGEPLRARCSQRCLASRSHPRRPPWSLTASTIPTLAAALLALGPNGNDAVADTIVFNTDITTVETQGVDT